MSIGIVDGLYHPPLKGETFLVTSLKEDIDNRIKGLALLVFSVIYWILLDNLIPITLTQDSIKELKAINATMSIVFAVMGLVLLMDPSPFCKRVLSPKTKEKTVSLPPTSLPPIKVKPAGSKRWYEEENCQNLEHKYFISLYKVKKSPANMRVHFNQYCKEDKQLKAGTYPITPDSPWESFAKKMQEKFNGL